MYKHQIDELIEKSRRELSLYRKYHREEEIKHVTDRLKSLRRIRENSRTARTGS